MIAKNLEETYSERAVVNFRKKISNCLNIFLIIVALFLIYILLIPNARYSKKEKTNTKMPNHVSDLYEI